MLCGPTGTHSLAGPRSGDGDVALTVPLAVPRCCCGTAGTAENRPVRSLCLRRVGHK